MDFRHGRMEGPERAAVCGSGPGPFALVMDISAAVRHNIP